MMLVMNQLLDLKLTEEDDEERKENSASTAVKEQEEETMALWGSVSLLDAEEDITKKHKDVREANVTTRSQGTIVMTVSYSQRSEGCKETSRRNFKINP